MKQKLTLLTILIALVGLGVNASANSTACSNAEQNFSYTHQRSNGGAPLDISTVSYKGLTQQGQLSGSALEINFSNVQQINKEISGSTTTIVSIALAKGVVHADEKSVAFSEWVICKDVEMPICYMCP